MFGAVWSISIFYLSSTKSHKKYYTRLKVVLDSALAGYNVRGGHMYGNNILTKPADKGSTTKPTFVACKNRKTIIGTATTPSIT